MLRAITICAAAAVAAGCGNEPTSPGGRADRPDLAVTSRSAGGVSFASGSGCTVPLTSFVCNLTVDGVGSTDQYGVSQSAQWHFQYQCLHKKTSRVSREGPRSGSVSAVDLRTLVGTNGQITITNTTLSPAAPTPCAQNKGAYTVTQFLTPFTPASWSLHAYKNDDPDNFFAVLFEVL